MEHNRIHTLAKMATQKKIGWKRNENMTLHAR